MGGGGAKWDGPRVIAHAQYLPYDVGPIYRKIIRPSYHACAMSTI